MPAVVFFAGLDLEQKAHLWMDIRKGSSGDLIHDKK